jgi:NAD(P)-dependent dehydrogenase (short-subunit alcohol dehydrogenase family)
MKDSLQGKVALVTGAGTGIGSATAKLLAAKGAAVLVTDFDDEAGQATTKAITDAGSEAVYLHADMSSPDDIGSMVATAVEKWGRLDCAVNNAGIAGILGASLADYPDDIFDKVGVFLCMKHQINQMLTQDSGGAIVNVASAAGLIGLPNAAYTASKHGVVGMTKSAAIAYSKNRIRINSVCPGYIDTPAIAPALNAGMRLPRPSPGSAAMPRRSWPATPWRSTVDSSRSNASSRSPRATRLLPVTGSSRESAARSSPR